MLAEAILDNARAIATDVVARETALVDKEALWPKQSIQALKDSRLTGLVVPECYGGLGHGLELLAKVGEIIGQECASTGLCFGMHCAGAAVLAAKPSDFLAERYLGPIAEGQHLTTLALSEPGTGAEFYYPQCQLTGNAKDTYSVNGCKSFVTNGSHADSYVISTIADTADNPSNYFSCLVLDGDADGIKWGDAWQGLGMRGNDSRSVELNNVQIDKNHLLGQEGDQIWYVFNVVAPYFLMAMSGTYLGLASACLNQAIDHLENRHYQHIGQSLSEKIIPQQRLGQLWARVESTRQLVYFAGAEFDRGGPKALPALLSVKSEVAQCVDFAVNEAMTLCGGRGYSTNSALARRLRDGRAAHVMSPLTDMLQVWLGRAVLQQPLLD